MNPQMVHERVVSHSWGRSCRLLALVMCTLVALCVALGVASDGSAEERPRLALDELGYAPARLQEIARIDREVVNPETWRRIELRHTTDDGEVVEMVLLRPLWWIEETGSYEGAYISLSMHELGVHGPCRVASITEPEVDLSPSPRRGCVQTPSGPRVVIGRFKRTSHVLDICLADGAGGSETVSTTAAHPFYSADRRCFVPAGQLLAGERLVGAESGERLTRYANQHGTTVRPNVKEFDFGFSVGTGRNGGMQSRVRVHTDADGRIHGHPSGPERH